MLLERLILKDFGCFEKRTLDFTPGLNLIYGPNFSGKSTLVSAVYFCLTGRALMLKVAPADLAQMGKASGTAGLEFEVDGEKYRVFRSTKGETQLSSWRDGSWDIQSSSRHVVDDELRRLLGIGYDRLAVTAFLREGEIAEFLTRQPADRKQMLYALLGIDELLRIRDVFVEVRKETKREEKRIQGHQASLPVMETRSRREEISRLEGEVRLLEGELDRLTEMTVGAGEGALFSELERQRITLARKLESLAEERRKLLEPYGSGERLEEAVQQIVGRLEKQGELEERRSRALSELGGLTAQLDALTEQRRLLAPLQQEGAGVICPVCEQPIEPAMVRRLFDEKEAEIARQQEVLARLRSELQEYAARAQELEQLSEQKRELEGKLHMLARLERDEAIVRAELNEVDARLSALGPGGRPVEAVAQAQRERSRLKAAIETKRAQIVRLTAEEAVLAQTLAEREQVMAEAERAKRNRLRAELACEAIDRTISALLGETLRPTEIEVQRLLAEFNVFDHADIDIHSEHLLPVLRWGEGGRDLASLSGSEKMILYLCVKVALGRVLGHFGGFIFDDPTLHLDGPRCQLMGRFIQTLANQQQVIVASNDEVLLVELKPENVIRL